MTFRCHSSLSVKARLVLHVCSLHVNVTAAPRLHCCMEEKCTHLNTVTHTHTAVLPSHFVVVSRTVEEALILLCVCVLWETSLIAHQWQFLQMNFYVRQDLLLPPLTSLLPYKHN